MNKIVLGLICIIIILNCSIIFAAENNTTSLSNDNDSLDERVLNENNQVNATKSGIRNITFSDGYNGYCINLSKDSAENGSVFTPKDTSHAMNNKYNTPIGNYLKILFVDFYDFTIKDADATSEVIWDFSDRYYLTSSNEITQTILKLADNGRLIPDHGETKKINDNTEAIFDFQVFNPLNDDLQNYFGYKITFKEITNETSDENNTTDINNTNNTSIENNTDSTSNNTNNTDNETINNDSLNNTNNHDFKYNNVSLSNSTSEKLNQSMILNDKSTGFPIVLLILILICSVFGCIRREF